MAETSDASLREAVLGSVGLVHKLRPGTIIVDLSDASPQTGPAIARSLYSKGTIWIEATPVGGPRAARDGTLTLLTAGPADALERVAPVLSAFAAKTLRLGEIGTGPMAKALAATLGTMSLAIHTELLLVAKKAGLDPTGILAALPVLAPGAGTPPAAVAEIISGRGQSTVSATQAQSDVARLLDTARSAGVPTPFAGLLQAALFSAAHSPAATGDHMDLTRWMADNAGVALGSA